MVNERHIDIGCGGCDPAGSDRDPISLTYMQAARARIDLKPRGAEIQAVMALGTFHSLMFFRSLCDRQCTRASRCNPAPEIRVLHAPVRIFTPERQSPWESKPG
jgi:hypothetical protein